MRVLISTQIPAPYQVELFDALSVSGAVELTVLYTSLTDPGRSWACPRLEHTHYILDRLGAEAARALVLEQDLVIFSGYHPRAIRELIEARAVAGKPWVFWGEKPGALLPTWLGKLYRAAVFPELRRSKAPIWGIGSWAVEAYKREVGANRTFLNLPYFSNLNRFLQIDRSGVSKPARRFLFSGSLIERKGVDLLMRAFVEVARENPELDLDLIGEGPLRPQLEAMSEPVAKQVHFHGFMQWEEIPPFYAQADVLCAPSRYDGWGLIIPEGLAAGLMVVSTDKTGAALDLLGSPCGWVVRAGAWEPLADALRSAANTAVADRRMQIERGRTVARQQNLDTGVRQVLDAIARCSPGWSGRSSPGQAL